MVGVPAALVAGLLAALLTLVVIMIVQEGSPPSTGRFWATYGPGEGRRSTTPHGVLILLVVGTVAGGLFGVGVTLLENIVGAGTPTFPLAAALAYAGGGFVLWRTIWIGHVLGTDVGSPAIIRALVYHTVYGLALGSVVILLGA